MAEVTGSGVALPPASTTRKGVDPSKFMGASFAAGSNLAGRVSNNERKITSLKNIIKLRKINTKKFLPASEESGEKDQTLNTNNLADRLNNISEALGVLFNLKKQELNADKQGATQDLRNQSQEQKAAREQELERKKKKKEASKPVALPKPFTGFFDTIKTFFGNILAGSVVLKMLKWVNDPANQESINKFTGFLKDNALKIVGLIAFIAGLGIVATLVAFTTALVGGIVALAPIIAFLLKAMAIGAAVAATVVAGKWLWKKGKEGAGWMHEQFAGGKASAAGDLANEATLREAGVSQNWLDRRLGRYTVHTREMNPHTGKMTDYVSSKGYKELTDEQKAAVDAFKAESKRMNDLEKERDQKIKELHDSLWEGPEGGTWKYTEGYARVPWNRRLTEEGKEKEKEINEKARGIYQNYEGKISSGDSAPLSKTPDIKPKVQSSSSPKQVPELKTDTSPKMSIQKTVPSREISQPLHGGEGEINFLDLSTSGDGGESGSGTESGNEGAYFSSSRGRVGNRVILGVLN